MPRVTIIQAKTSTLREIYETEKGRDIPDRLKGFVAEIEKELEKRGELLVVRHQ